MELRHLRYFLVVANLSSFTRAAAALHLTQPTLSHQIRQLEDELGMHLFDRIGRSIRLTAPGKVFREHAERALQEVSTATAALKELQGLMHGTLTIGVFQSFNSSLMPPILAAFAARYPGVRVAVRQLPTREMQTQLIRGELDLGIAYVQPDSHRILAEKLFDERLMLVVSEGHPYCGAAKAIVPADRGIRASIAARSRVRRRTRRTCRSTMHSARSPAVGRGCR